MLDFIVKVNKKHYPQTLLEECKQGIKSTEMEKLIGDDLDPSSSDESDSESDVTLIVRLIMNLTMILMMNLVNNLLINAIIKSCCLITIKT